MFEGYQNTEELTQNLIDAGCGEERLACFLSCLLNGDRAESLRMLEEWRADLLREIHKERACMEYLDQLLYDLRETPR